MRRSAYLAVGLADTSAFCPDWAASDLGQEKKAWYEFCKTLWAHGLSVAALDWEARWVSLRFQSRLSRSPSDTSGSACASNLRCQLHRVTVGV